VFVSDNCLGPIKKPVVSSCCRSLLGCKDCCDQWFIGSSRCPKCSSDTGRDGRIDVCGLDDTFQMLLPLISTDADELVLLNFLSLQKHCAY